MLSLDSIIYLSEQKSHIQSDSGMQLIQTEDQQPTARARPRPSPDAVGARVSPKIREQYARSPSLSVGRKEAQRKRSVIAEQETPRRDSKATHDQMRRLGLEEAQRNRFLLTGGAQEHVIEKMFKQRPGARPRPAGPSHGNQNSPFYPI